MALEREARMNTNELAANSERVVNVQNGWLMLPLLLALLGVTIALLVTQMIPIFFAIVVFVAFVVLFTGFFTLQPNEARVLVLFGAYKGTVRTSGFHWGNPFYSNGPQQPSSPGQPDHAKTAEMRTSRFVTARLGRNKISLRARTLNGDKLKVNDKRGNPIGIAAVVVWRVADTAQAMFDVDNYANYIPMQSESALRHLANQYSYDYGEDDEPTLRSNVDDISQALRRELQERLGKAGVLVDEARLTHLAYAPEIAQAMLRRQQAEAVIAAPQKLVQGAVSMVDMALKELADKRVVELDSERKAAMVSNLLVVLCGESEVHPVVNTGTLYN